MKQEIKNIIKEIKKVKNSEQKKLLNNFEVLLELIKKYKGRKNFTDKELEKMQNVLCFKDLSFCCRKHCVMRNTVLHILGIKPERFEKEKIMLMKNWLRGDIKCLKN